MSTTQRTSRQIHDRLVDFGAAPAVIIGVLLFGFGGLSRNYTLTTIACVLAVVGVLIGIIASLIWAKNTPEQ